MFITADILRRYGFEDQDIDYIENFYPNGTELIEVLCDKNIKSEFLHQCCEYLITTEKERIAYREVCNIINSEGYWYSTNIHDSKYVVKSKNVNNSQSIFESKDINKCHDIVNTDDAEDSSQIFYSLMIEGCNKICNGINITSSTNVCNSTMVARGVSVINSNMVFDSSEIVNCNTVSNSHFCQDCTNITKCLFCEGLVNAEYHIFNKPVDPKMYELFEKQYLKYMSAQLAFIAEWPEHLAIGAHVAPTRKFDDWYHPISEKFWKWVRTLPGYDSMLLYRITMLPKILIEER